MKLYLAHPMTSLDYDTVMNYYRYVESCLIGKYDFLCPMTGKSYLKSDKNLKALGYTQPPSTDHAITERDSWMVKSSDVVLIDFSDSKKVSIGCICELSWAYLKHKHTIIVLESGNCHNHAFVKEMADIVYDNLNDAINYLIELSDGIQ